MSENEKTPSPSSSGHKSAKKSPHYKLSQVILAVISFYTIIVLFDSKGIHVWSTKIPVNQGTQTLRQLAEGHWRRMASLGLEEPKFTMETLWLDLQEAHPLLYPRKYETQKLANQEWMEKKRKRETEWVKNPKLKSEYDLSREIASSTKSKKGNGRKRVLIVGDSLMMTVGPILKSELERDQNVHVTLKAKLATGLARPDVFDWKGEIDQLINQNRFQSVIILMGANDSQDFAVNGEILSYGTPEWVKTYKGRIAGIMDGICQSSAQGIWIGLPPMQSRNFQRKAARLNQWIARASERYDCMKYLDTTNLFGSSDGSYLSYLTVDGKSEKIRMTDGIHITKKGAVLLIDPVLAAAQVDSGTGQMMSH